MMPESYADLIPAPPEPIYKYTSEGASEYNETCNVSNLKIISS